VRAQLAAEADVSEDRKDVSEYRSYEYEGYTIRNNPDTGRWEILWKERVQSVDFPRAADAEQWIDDQMPLNR
jgi:hypothetical protein